MTTDYFINHRLRAGLARIEGLAILLQFEDSATIHVPDKFTKSFTIELLLKEVEQLKKFTDTYNRKQEGKSEEGRAE